MRRSILGPLALLAALLALPGAGRAQELQFYTVSFLGGLASSLEGEGSEVDSTALQAGFGFATSERSRLNVRVGRIGFDEDDVVSGIADPELTYLTVAGEVRFDETIYDSGVYIGVGGYRLRGVEGRSTELGVTLGYTGEFELTRHLSLALELVGHFADFVDDKLYGQGMGGLAVHF
ncbi:MAG: hypothetical protein ACRD2Z_10435 [Thermoanaerobaculia bacterium]